MNTTTYKRFSPLKCLAIAALSSSILACGGGSSSSSSTGEMPSTEAQGRLAVMMTDATADGYSEVWVTFTSATLIGGTSASGEAVGDVEVFSGTKTINLLSLANTSEIFLHGNRIASGTFSKLRLQVSDIQLIQKDAEGMVIESVSPNVVANGKLDLLAQSGINVQENQTTFLSLDFDAEKSIHTSNSGSINFRPVVFVEAVSTTVVNTKPIQVTGTLQSEVDAQGNPVICEGNDNTLSAAICFSIHVDSQTQIFDSSGESATDAELISGTELTLFGSLASTTHIEGETDSFIALSTDFIQVGHHDSTFTAYGTVQSGIDLGVLTGLQLSVDVSSGLSATGDVSLAIAAEATVYAQDHQQSDVSALNEGDEIQIFGIVTSDQALVITAVFIENQDTTALEGSINTIDDQSSTFDLATAEGDVCVTTSSSTLIQQSSSIDGSLVLADALFADLSVDQTVELESEQQVDGCFQATSIVIWE